jgi:hypothetical protein
MSPEQSNLLRQACDYARRVADNLDEAIEDIGTIAWLKPGANELPSKAERYVIDGFLKRFSDGAEAGRRLLRAGLIPLGENDPKLSFIDILNKAEKFDILTSARAWRDAVDVRNQIAHEYAMDRDEAKIAVGQAYQQARQVSDMLRHALARIDALMGES